MIETFPMAYVKAPGEVAFQQRALPLIGPKDVKIRVKAVTLCGSDLHIFKGKHPAAALPMPIGHEIAGEIVATGDQVSDLRIGDRVAVEPVLVCGECHFCQRGEYSLCTDISFQYRRGQGGITPYFVVPEKWAHRLPDGLSDLEGALMEPLAVAIHAVNKSQFELGSHSAIFGAGAIGLLVLQVLRMSGAGKVFMVDINSHRLRTAEHFGANLGLNNLEVDALQIISNATGGLGVERSYEAVGLESTLTQALLALRKGGVTTLVGLFEMTEVKIPANLFVQKEISLIGSQGYCWDFQTAIQLADQKKLNLSAMITHEFQFNQVQEAFETLLDPDSKAIKVAILIE